MLPGSVVLLVVLVTVPAARNVQSANVAVFHLAQTWPPGLCFRENQCNNTCSPKGFNYWTIHGLWPKGLQPCSNATFDLNSLKSIKTDLEKYWPNLHTEGPRDGLWEHEWNEHGKCAFAVAQTNTELKYFEQAIHLRRGIDLYGYLETGGIVPDPGKSYTARDINAVLRRNLKNARVKIRCTIDKSSGRHYLTEVHVCMSRSFALADCSKESSGVLTFEPTKQKHPHCRNVDCPATHIYYLPNK